MDKVKEWFQKNKKSVLIGCAVVLALIIIYYLVAREHLQEISYLDQMAMKNFDPMHFKYTGRERDLLGMSPRDYYLENKMHTNSRATTQNLDARTSYLNNSNYNAVPARYRHHALEDIRQAGLWSSDERPILQSVESAEPYV